VGVYLYRPRSGHLDVHYCHFGARSCHGRLRRPYGTAWQGKREEHRRLLKLKRLVDGPSEKLDDLLGYLEENWDGIYGSRNLKSKVGAKEVLVVGSGGIEKNIDLMLCRRFKGRGMSWSRAGAQNLLKLRLLRYDRKDWNAYWRRRGKGLPHLTRGG